MAAKGMRALACAIVLFLGATIARADVYEEFVEYESEETPARNHFFIVFEDRIPAWWTGPLHRKLDTLTGNRGAAWFCSW